MEELIDKNGNTDELIINLSELHLNARHFEKVVNILDPLYENGQYSLDILRMLLISFSMLGQIENEISIGKHDWKGGFLITSDNLIKHGGKELLAQTFLNIGAANPQNFLLFIIHGDTNLI